MSSSRQMFRFQIIILLMGCVNPDVFTLLESKNAESETRCTTGLISNADRILFKSRINMTASTGTSTINFEIVSSQNKSLHYICDLVIPSDCNGNKYDISKCPCKTLDNMLFETDVKINAMTRYNGGIVNGNLYNSNYGVIRRHVRFPEVYESINATGILIINDKLMSTPCDVCETHVSDSHLTVNFSCQSPASPCLIEMIINDTYGTVHCVNNSHTINFNKIIETPDTLHLHIKYAACRLDGEVKSINCNIKIKNRKSEVDQTVNRGDIISAVFGVIIVILSVIIIRTHFKHTIMCCRIKCKRCCSSWRNANRDATKTVEYDLSEDRDQSQSSLIQTISIINTPYPDGRGVIPSTQSEESTNLLNKQSLQEHGPVEIELLKCENGILNFQKNYDACTNKKDHERFIDVDGFDIHHLPDGFKDIHVMKLIKSMAELTVLLAVNVGTDLNSSRNLKIGNGFIGHISVYTEEEDYLCCCRECLLSSTPSKHFANVVVYTSTHVVSNNKEGLSTTCKLFYDNHDSQTFTFRDYTHGTINENREKFKLNYVTCKYEIIKRLQQAVNTWTDLYPKINMRYKQQSDRNKTVIIVSHVHGIHKRISIGKYSDFVDLRTKDEYDNVTQYIYEAPTCVGSTGAYVYIVARDKKGWLNQHLHIGVNEKGFKLCGKGTDYFD